MAQTEMSVQLEERKVVGKGLSGLRHDGLVPAVIHNHGQESVHVMATEKDLLKVYHEAGKHHPLELHVGKNNYLALIKDVQFNPVKRRMQHVVFQAIRRDEKVEAEVPIHLEGDAPAEKVGLMVLHQLDAVEVEALPQNLPDALTISAERLAELHDKIVVGDLSVPEGVTILTEPDHPIASVVETKAQIAEEAEETEEAEAAEGDGETGTASEGAEAAATGQEAPKE